MANVVLRIDGSGVVEDLGRGVSVGGAEQQTAAELGLQLDFSAVRECLIDVEIFSDEGDWIDGFVIDLVVKQIVEIRGVENIFAAKKILLKPGFEGTDTFWFEGRVGDGIGRAGKCFFETRFFESRCIGKAQARSGE